MDLRKILTAVTAAAVTASISGCSVNEILWGESSSGETSYVSTPEEAPEAPAEISADSADVYAADFGEAAGNMTFTAECFYGKYTIDRSEGYSASQLDGPETQAFLGTHHCFFESPVDGTPLIAVPYRIEAGPHSNVTTLNYVPGRSWIQLYLVTAAGTLTTLQASYRVEGDKLLVQPVQSSSFDSENSQLDYALSETELEYGYSFDGTDLTLTCGDDIVTLHAEDIYSGRGVSLTDSNLKSGSPSLAGIERLDISGGSGTVTEDGTEYPCTASFGENGLCTLLWNGKSCKLAYFCCGDDGIVFSDGTQNYIYTARSWDLFASGVTANLSAGDEEKLSELSEEEITAIVNRSEQLYSDLNAAFAEAGINAQIMEDTGEIALDSVVLFGLGESEVSDEGREFIGRFLNAYTSVIFSDEYAGFISKIMVEGHTDRNGSYEYNLDLSRSRADSVRQYCLSEDTGLSREYTERLAGLLSSVGYSYDVPVLNEDGSVNNSASRRVSFRFLINVD